MLPLVVLHRMECVIVRTKKEVLATADKLAGRGENVNALLRQGTGGEQLYNNSPLTMGR